MFKKAFSATAVILLLLAAVPMTAADREGRERAGFVERGVKKVVRFLKMIVAPTNEGITVPKP
ncbi:MAG: hypothetical protein QOH21_2502 [Acidobacteriota bacterium]|jgi:hypothetical protein|nr:hypothetical protein [Acidobacteriota bacterium]